MIECLLSICKVPGSIPSNGKTYSVYQNGIANQEMPEVLFEVDFFFYHVSIILILQMRLDHQLETQI